MRAYRFSGSDPSEYPERGWMVHAQDSHQADGQWPVLDALVDRVLDARRQIAAAQAAEAQLLAEAVTIIADRTDTLRQHA